MDQVIKKAVDAVSEKMRPKVNSGDDIEQRIKELQENGEWPFTTVSPEEFLAYTRPLIQTIYDIYKESDTKSKVPVEIIQDRIAYTTVDMLKCVQRMELEAKSQEIAETVCQAREESYSSKAYDMLTIVDWAKNELYRYSNQANDFMAHTYKDENKKPIYISRENEREFIPNLAVSHTYTTTREHSRAFKEVADRFDELMKYGVPSESAVGKLVDSVLNFTETKAENEKAVHNLLARELDIEYIENFIIPNLSLKAIELQAEAALDDNARKRDGRGGRSEYWQDYKCYDKALQSIDRAIKNMRNREAEMCRDAKLIISRGEDGTYSITATRQKGEVREAKVKDGEVEYTRTTEKNIRGRTRTFEFGKMTQQLRDEQSQRFAKIRGYKEETKQPTYREEKNNEQKKVIKERAVGEISISRNHKKSERLKLTANLARLEGRVVLTHNVVHKTKSKTIASGKAQILGASSTFALPTKESIGTPTLSAEAHPLKLNGQYRGLSASFSTGPSVKVGKQMSVADIVRKSCEIFDTDLTSGDATNLTKAIDKVSEMLREFGPSAGMDWGRIEVSLSDIKIFQAKAQVPAHDIEQTQDTSQSQDKGQEQQEQFSIEMKSPFIEEVRDDLETISGIGGTVQNAVSDFWAEYLSGEQSQTVSYSQNLNYGCDERTQTEDELEIER